MPKNILEDIKPLTRQSDAPPVRTPRTRKKIVQEEMIEPSFSSENEDADGDSYEDQYVPPTHYNNRPRRRFSPSAGWIIAVILALGVVVGGSLVFSKADVDITRKSETGVLDDLRITAVKGEDAAEGELAFEVMSVEAEVSKTLSSTSKENAKIAATGRVVIFNDYNTSPQNLVANTRLQTKDGKIYRIQKAVTVPGKKGSTPGSVEVDVKADVAGSEYNLEFADLYVTGFKGTPKYEKFYARTKGPLSGGREGEKYVVSGDTVLQAKTELSADIRAKLLREAKSQVPEGYVLFEGALTISETASSETVFYADTEDVPVTTKGTLTAVLLPKDALSALIAKKTLSQYDGAPVSIPAMEMLTVAFDRAYSDLKNAQEVDLVMSGSATIDWVVDTEAVEKALLGVSKKEFNSIMAGFGSVHSAELHLRPFWMPNIPKDAERVELSVETAEAL